MEEKKIKIQAGIIEVLPEGEKVPVEVEVPAKQIATQAVWNEGELVFVPIYGADISDEERKCLCEEAMKKALAKNQQEWEEFKKNRSPTEDKKRLLKSLFGE